MNGQQLNNKRVLSRQRTFLGAQIVMKEGTATLDCMVRNLSASGALVKVEAALTVPDQFTLAIPGKGDFLAEVKWRKISELGVAFKLADA